MSSDAAGPRSIDGYEAIDPEHPEKNLSGLLVGAKIGILFGA